MDKSIATAREYYIDKIMEIESDRDRILEFRKLVLTLADIFTDHEADILFYKINEDILEYGSYTTHK